MHERFQGAAQNEHKLHLEVAGDYIRKHYSETLSLEKLAAVAHISKYHFHRLFHRHFGETVHDCVRRTRLEHAARMLATSKNASVAEIAGKCGFSSSQNFARAFKFHFGGPPTSIRKKPACRATTASGDRREGGGSKLPLSVEVKKLPSCRVAYLRDVGPYRSESNRETFVQLFQWAFAEGLAGAPSVIPIGVCWSDPASTPAEACVFDACLTVSDGIEGNGPVRIQYLPGGGYAVLHCECRLDRLIMQTDRLFQEWLPRSSSQRDQRPVFLIYYNNPEMNPRQLAIVDVCVPIKT